MSETAKPKLSEITNPLLVEAMNELKDKKTAEAERNFMQELGKARLLSPAVIRVMDENGEYQEAKEGQADPEKTQINFMMLSNANGEKFLPAFTNLEEVRKWRKEENLQNVVTNIDNYMSIILSDDDGPKGLVIDPFGSNIILPKQLFETIAEQQGRQKGEQIQLGEASEYPQDLLDALSAFFDENGHVENAYIQMMKRGEKVGFLVVVEYDSSEDRRTLFDAIAAAAKGHLSGLDLSIASIGDAFGKKAAENKMPFYTR